MASDNTNESAGAKQNGQKPKGGKQPRVISNPSDVAGLVMMQLDAVNGKKDELTIAIKNLSDTAKQLVRAYADHTRTIQQLAERVRKLEEKSDKA